MNILKPFINVCKYKYSVCKFSSKVAFKPKKPPWRVLFFGSDEFSLYSLKSLFNEHKSQGGVLNTLEVVTNSRNNPVWKFAEAHKLPILKWPLTIHPSDYDLGLVVSFGHLIPEAIIKAFPLGILNVHASLLPKFRGAAPIIHALANGDKETGITIMKIKPKHFDIGEIVFQEKVPIDSQISLPELHEKLGKLGAQCLLDTLRNLPERFKNCRPQTDEGATYAPKITSQFAKINWNIMTATHILNLQRALKTVLPLTTTWNSIPVKLFDIDECLCVKQCKIPGFVEFDKKSQSIKVECANRTWISVRKVGIQGKRTMTSVDFNNGYIKKLVDNKVACFK